MTRELSRSHGSGEENPRTEVHAELARDAVVWGLPLVLLGRYLGAAVDQGVPFNRFFMNADIATPRSGAIGPNIDTLNGRAWFDLSEGPQVIEVPDTDDRYYSIHLQDMYMNSFAYIGRRTYGTRAGTFVLTPPGYKGSLPAGATEVAATTDKVFAFLRILVRSRDDLPAVRALSRRFSTAPAAAVSGGRRAAEVSADILDRFQPAARRLRGVLPHDDLRTAGLTYYDELNSLLATHPPSAADSRYLSRFAQLGIGPGKEVARDEPARGVLEAAVPAGIDLALASLEDWSDNGWSRRRNIAPFIEDPTQRAANNIYGPSTQVAEESVFFNLWDGPDGEVLSGETKRYRLRFPAGGLPPVDAFWSLTLYDRKRYALFDNPLDRYGFSDRSPDVRFGPDGSLEIRIQAADPGPSAQNWLPAPREPFELILRTYQPRAEVLDRTYTPPAIELLEGTR